jgi:hypothetical protein
MLSDRHADLYHEVRRKPELCGAEEGRGVLLGVVREGSGGVLQVGFPAVDRPVGAIGHPFAARGGMECCDRCGWSGSIRGGDSPGGGGHDLHDPRPAAVVVD